MAANLLPQEVESSSRRGATVQPARTAVNGSNGFSLSVHLHRELHGRAVVLDDRRVPGAKAAVTHIVVAPSGVWVVESKDLEGRVERHDVGGWFRVDERLFVAGKDKSHLVDGLDRHVIAIENLLAQAGLTSVPVHAALCFVNAEWGWFAKPFSLSGVWVTWPERLTELVLEWKAIPDTEFDSLARAIAARLSS
ncbi:MAG: nuclease-related domain-containing protein [Ilumatobacteraceae bacterium]